MSLGTFFCHKMGFAHSSAIPAIAVIVVVAMLPSEVESHVSLTFPQARYEIHPPIKFPAKG